MKASCTEQDQPDRKESVMSLRTGWLATAVQGSSTISQISTRQYNVTDQYVCRVVLARHIRRQQALPVNVTVKQYFAVRHHSGVSEA